MPAFLLEVRLAADEIIQLEVAVPGESENALAVDGVTFKRG